jgi:PIN domain nuclease of toxin-antitoxin system
LILLDTNVAVWLFQADPQLAPTGRRRIERERSAEGVCISAITCWEVSMLVEKGRLILGRDPLDWIETALAEPGVHLAPLNPAIGIDAGRLPAGIHGDPADRLLIATARHLACPLLTTDRKILTYAAAGHLKAIDARR